MFFFFFFQAEDGIRYLVRSRGLGDVYKRQIIHNGIIENYASLKTELIKRGHQFLSDTDTEVLIHLIEDIQLNEKTDLVEAVRIALNQVIGAYAIVIISKDNPDILIAARKSSPLVILSLIHISEPTRPY